MHWPACASPSLPPLMVIHWEAASSALDRIMGTFHVRNAKGRMAVIAEIKFGQVTVKVSFAAMLVNTLNATLEHAPDVLNCVGVNVAANVLILGMSDRVTGCNSLPVSV